MTESGRIYYKTCRELAGFTQEHAAECLVISVRALSRYENGEATPCDDIVKKMVKIYKTKLLGWWHLRNTSSLARECLPEILPPQSDADVYMQIDFSEDDICAIKKDYKAIMRDGRISKDELEDFRRIQEKAKIAAGKLISVYTYEPVIESEDEGEEIVL